MDSAESFPTFMPFEKQGAIEKSLTKKLGVWNTVRSNTAACPRNGMVDTWDVISVMKLDIQYITIKFIDVLA